jgi:hypothetical protein
LAQVADFLIVEDATAGMLAWFGAPHAGDEGRGKRFVPPGEP